MLPNCYAISALFAVAQAESGRQWNDKIKVNITSNLTTMVFLYLVLEANHPYAILERQD